MATNNKMFEIASRKKFRFPSSVGNIHTEDLWDLSVEQLDSIFKTLNSQVKASQEESLLQTRTPEDEILQTKIDIVRHIVAVKLDESNKAIKAKENAEQREKIMAILADKKDEDLRNKSPEELQEMLNNLK